MSKRTTPGQMLWLRLLRAGPRNSLCDSSTCEISRFDFCYRLKSQRSRCNGNPPPARLPLPPIPAYSLTFNNTVKQSPGTFGTLAQGHIVTNAMGSCILLQRSLPRWISAIVKRAVFGLAPQRRSASGAAIAYGSMSKILIMLTVERRVYNRLERFRVIILIISRNNRDF